MHNFQHIVEGKYRHIYEHRMHSNDVLSTENSIGPELSTQIAMRNSQTSHALVILWVRNLSCSHGKGTSRCKCLFVNLTFYSVSWHRQANWALLLPMGRDSYPSTSMALQDVCSIRSSHHSQHIKEVSECIRFPVASLPKVQDMLRRTRLASKVIQVSAKYRYVCNYHLFFFFFLVIFPQV